MQGFHHFFVQHTLKGRFIKWLKFGSIVLSTAGRDKGLLFFVTDISEKDFVYLTDGNIHKIENQKLKKIKHVSLTDYIDKKIASKIANKQKITNQEVKKALKKFGKEEKDV